MKHSLKIFWMILGFLCLGLGTVGIILPILPTVPFYMATLFCFCKKVQKDSIHGFLEQIYIKNIWTVLCRREL